MLKAKHCDRLPHYPQEQIAKLRHGIGLHRQVLAHWAGLSAEWLRPVYQILLSSVWSEGYAQIDEPSGSELASRRLPQGVERKRQQSVIKYLEPGTGKAAHDYFWAIERPGGDAVFHWATRHANEVLARTTFSLTYSLGTGHGELITCPIQEGDGAARQTAAPGSDELGRSPFSPGAPART